MKRFVITLALSASLATSALATTLTDTFTSFTVLGDSLSDNGNLFDLTGIPGDPYVDGRFSDGLVWNESIAQEFMDAGQLSANFAFGGATASGGTLPPSVDLQALNFATIPAAAAGSRPLVSIWAGANDIRDALSSDNPFSALDVGAEAANSIANTISGLSALGVNDFLVLNLPDLGLIPELIGSAGSPLGTAATTAFNGQLAGNIAALELSGINIIDVDINALFDAIVADPEASGFSNVSDGCIFNPGTCDPSSWFFFDSIHPTAVGHAEIDEQVRAVLASAIEVSAVPLPATAPLLLFAILGVRALARRT